MCEITQDGALRIHWTRYRQRPNTEGHGRSGRQPDASCRGVGYGVPAMIADPGCTADALPSADTLDASDRVGGVHHEKGRRTHFAGRLSARHIAMSARFSTATMRNIGCCCRSSRTASRAATKRFTSSTRTSMKIICSAWRRPGSIRPPLSEPASSRFGRTRTRTFATAASIKIGCCRYSSNSPA